ncbi:hypothetical protein ABW21_db0201749 [Orbilia brochopaga]|nr:hypothetical protein ABW21_db0201749 [Drechslerella brochopaga]
MSSSPHDRDPSALLSFIDLESKIHLGFKSSIPDFQQKIVAKISHKPAFYHTSLVAESYRQANSICANPPTGTMAAAPPLSVIYAGYIHAINERDWGILETMLQPQVIWNNTSYTTEEYLTLITRATIPAPDIKFNIDWLVVDDAAQRVAVRLLIRGTPRHEFLGLKPTGRTVEIVEHAFYAFVDGKIAEVRTVIDMDGLREQMR